MKERLDLLLINPGARSQVYGKLGSSLAGIEPALWCAQIAAYVREHGYSVSVIDAEAENWSPEYTAEKAVEYNPLLIAVIVLGSNPSASSTPKMTSAGQLLQEIRKQSPETRTLIGGLHPSALPERTLREEAVDYLAQGEGFHTVLELLQALKSGIEPAGKRIPGLWYVEDGSVVSNPRAPLVDPDELPIAAWDLLPMDKYRAHNWHCFEHIDQRQPYAFMFTSLGCPFNCSYCNIHALYNDNPGIRFRSPEKVVEEIDLLVGKYGVKNIKFMDELFAIKEDRVSRLCDLIIQRGYDLNIWAYARVDTVSERMMWKMKQAGINWLCYGFESANQRVRSGVAKKTEEEITEKAIKITQDANIYILANFIFGLPEDDLETMQQTLDMARDYNFEYVNFYMAMAYPGSQLYWDALKDGVKLPESWHGYGQFSYEALPLPTKYISAAEVVRFRDSAFNDYFNNQRYLEMIGKKFGHEVVEHIRDMLKFKIQRKYT